MTLPVVVFDPEVEAFRGEVREFFAEHWTPERYSGRLDSTDLTGVSESLEREFVAQCGQRGWLGLGVPVEQGGRGLGSSWSAAFAYEAAYHDAPVIDTAVTLAGPAVFRFASPAQRSVLVPPMLAGRSLAAIAYSEPDAGTDLAAITTTAERQGDGFVLNGVKAHVTGAHKADWCVTLALTHPERPPWEAMTMFVVPMDLPGVVVERVAMNTGWTLSTVRFEQVALGPDAVLGTMGEGWSQVIEALDAERSGMFWLGWAVRLFDELVTVAPRSESVDRALAERWLDLRSAWWHARAVIDAQDQGIPVGPRGSAAKVAATEVLQALARDGADWLGPDGLVMAPLVNPLTAPVSGRVGWELIDRVRESIAVGPNELHRTAIARALPTTASADQQAGRLGSVVAGLALELSDGQTNKAAVVDEKGGGTLVPNLEEPGEMVVVRGDQAWLVAHGGYEAEPTPTVADEPVWTVRVAAEGRYLGDGAAAVVRGRIAAAQVEVAEAALAHAAATAAGRKVFGQSVNRFGAVQTVLADAALATAAARAALEGDRPAIALALSYRAALLATAAAQQVGGAAGLGADQPLHRWYRRARVLRQWPGRPETLLDELAASIRDQTRQV